jgi:hypothetical protein
VRPQYVRAFENQSGVSGEISVEAVGQGRIFSIAR